jgi:hypothetical protein
MLFCLPKVLTDYKVLCVPPLVLQVPILFSLSQDQLWQLVRLLQPVTFAKGATVFKKGDYADKFYVVESGTLTCFTRKYLICVPSCAGFAVPYRPLGN